MIKINRVSFACWLLGHEVTGESGTGTYRNGAGELRPAWRSFCARCGADDFPAHRRTLYHRSIGWRLLKYKNKYLSFGYMRWKRRN